MQQQDRSEGGLDPQKLPPDYLAPLGPEDDEGFVGIDLDPVGGQTIPIEDFNDNQDRLPD